MEDKDRICKKCGQQLDKRANEVSKEATQSEYK